MRLNVSKLHVNQSQLRMRPQGSWRKMQISTGTCLSFHPGFWTEDSNIVNRKMNRKTTQKKIKNTSQILVRPETHFSPETLSPARHTLNITGFRSGSPQQKQSLLLTEARSLPCRPWASANWIRCWGVFVSKLSWCDDAPSLPVDVVKAYLSVLPEVSRGTLTLFHRLAT